MCFHAAAQARARYAVGLDVDLEGKCHAKEEEKFGRMGAVVWRWRGASLEWE
jgi:hypothetical protein